MSASSVSNSVRAASEEGEVVERKFVCDNCGRRFTGDPGGAGLLLWTRGDEVRFEEPPLCERCAAQLTVGAWAKWSTEPGEV